MACANSSARAPIAEEDMALRLDLNRLKGLPGGQLQAVYDALKAAHDGAQGVVNQPRCLVEGGFNPAGDMIDDMLNWLGLALDRVADAAEAREPQDEADSEMCAWTVVRHRASLGDNMDDLIAVASSLATQHRHRRFSVGRQL